MSMQAPQPEQRNEEARRPLDALGTLGARHFDFTDARHEWRRLFSEAFGTFLLVLTAVGGGMVNARFGGDVIPLTAQVTAPGLMVGAIILFMGAVSGAHLNPGVSIAFALRHDFPWRRVPGYIAAQFAGAILATLFLVALLGEQGTAGLTLPGPGIGGATAMIWEMVLTVGLISTILGTASGAQNIGAMNAIGVASYIVLAGLWGAPVSGASMNTARSLGPALVLGNFTAWWAYLVGPIAGAIIAAGIAYILRGPGGGFYGIKAARGTLGWLWQPGPIETAVPGTPEEVAAHAVDTLADGPRATETDVTVIAAEVAPVGGSGLVLGPSDRVLDVAQDLLGVALDLPGLAAGLLSPVAGHLADRFLDLALGLADRAFGVLIGHVGMPPRR